MREFACVCDCTASYRRSTLDDILIDFIQPAALVIRLRRRCRPSRHPSGLMVLYEVGWLLWNLTRILAHFFFQEK